MHEVISIEDFEKVLASHKDDPATDFINVCTPEEYVEKHIAGVRSVPLDTLADHVDEFASKETVYVHCRSGKRAQKAIEQMRAADVSATLVNVEGGILAWEEKNLPLNQ